MLQLQFIFNMILYYFQVYRVVLRLYKGIPWYFKYPPGTMHNYYKAIIFIYLQNWPCLFIFFPASKHFILFYEYRVFILFCCLSLLCMRVHTHKHTRVPLMFYVLNKLVQTEWIWWPILDSFLGIHRNTVSRIIMISIPCFFN